MWRFGLASVAGTAHAKSSLPCQDASRAEVVVDASGDDVLLAVASDGAGSAAQSQIGARLACDLFAEDVRAFFTAGGELRHLTGDFIGEWIARFQRAVAERAQAGNLKPQDFACTLLAAVVGRERAAYFQLGDGAMVEARRGEAGHYRCVCWPQQGEYVNTTNFLTDADAAEKVFAALTDEAPDEIAIFTDGLQGLVLDYRTQAAHAPFFAPLFAWLRPRPAGLSAELSDSLAVYLSSEKINARTDDDKTLILATRRAA
jgi:hypothetical protein